jgi:hypothetical protein
MRGALEAAAVRVAPSMNAQAVANIIWGLATLGWQAGEAPMRGALEAAAVRVAPSMQPQNLANTIWGLATLDWQAGEGLMRDALEAAAGRVAPSMNPQEVANTIWGLATIGWQACSDLGAVFQHLVARMTGRGGRALGIEGEAAAGGRGGGRPPGWPLGLDECAPPAPGQHHWQPARRRGP